MKRKAAKAKALGQPSPKKHDSTVSTDLRSKIGYKLQTLLNGMDSDCPLFIQYKKQLYADLIREPQYSEIIIDPSIVVKIEDHDSEQSRDALSFLSSENFLIAAKSRLTELLHKQQESERENTEGIPSSSEKSKSATAPQSPAVIDVSDSSNSSHSDVTIYQGEMQTAISDENSCSGRRSKTSLSSSPKPSPEKVPVPNKNKSAKYSQKFVSDESCDSSELEKNNNKMPLVSSALNKRLRNQSIDSDVACLNENDEDEEAAHSPEECLPVEENAQLSNAADDASVSNSESDEDVVFWCEKKPTFDVITLEEDEDSSDIVEELHACKQCGKTFRARFLLNFHIKMHGNSSFQATS